MNKRGQVYIIAALILSVVIFLLISQTNFVQRILIEDDFEQISQNYDIESEKFMNNLLAQGEITDINSTAEKFRVFTVRFTEYATIENPSFEFIYIFDHGDYRIFGNYMLDTIYIGDDLQELEGIGEFKTGISNDQIGVSFLVTRNLDEIDNLLVRTDKPTAIKIRDTIYNLEVSSGSSQIVIISREQKGEQTKVYLNEEFVTGRKEGLA